MLSGVDCSLSTVCPRALILYRSPVERRNGKVSLGLSSHVLMYDDWTVKLLDLATLSVTYHVTTVCTISVYCIRLHHYSWKSHVLHSILYGQVLRYAGEMNMTNIRVYRRKTSAQHLFPRPWSPHLPSFSQGKKKLHGGRPSHPYSPGGGKLLRQTLLAATKTVGESTATTTKESQPHHQSKSKQRGTRRLRRGGGASLH